MDCKLVVELAVLKMFEILRWKSFSSFSVNLDWISKSIVSSYNSQLQSSPSLCWRRAGSAGDVEHNDACE